MNIFSRFGKNENFDKAKDKHTKRYSFIIAPSDAGKTRAFTLSAFWFRNAILFAALFVVASVLLLISYIGLSGSYLKAKQDLATMKNINREQQEQLYGMSELAKDVEQQLVYLNLLETRINTLIDENDNDRQSSNKSTEASAYASGGNPILNEINANIERLEGSIASVSDTSAATASYFIDSDPVSKYDIRETIYKINTVFSSLNIDIDDEVSKVDEIEETIEAKDDYAECYPDFFPLAAGARYSVSDYFGYRTDPYVGFHAGIDLSGRHGTMVLAAGKGKVEYAGYNGSYGNVIVINHGYGLKTAYAHLSKIKVKVGQKVAKGDLIGLTGSTGYSTGSHLHFEVRENGKKVNPLKYISLR